MQKPIHHVETRKTKIDRVCDVVAAGLFLAVMFYTFFQWGKLPDEVPIHFNLAGEVDNFGSKWFLLLLPMIGLGLFALLEGLERYPEAHNYPKRLTEANAKRFYQASRGLLNRVKNLSLLLIGSIQLEIVRAALGDSMAMSLYVFLIILVLMCTVIIAGVAQMRQIK